MNFQIGSGSSLGNNLVNLVIPDFDEVYEKEKTKEEIPKQLEERWKWIEEKFKAMESTESYRGVDAKDLSLVSDLMLLHKFKMPEFEKYNGTSCPEALITMFCRRMTGYVDNTHIDKPFDQFLESSAAFYKMSYNSCMVFALGFCIIPFWE